MWRKSLTDKKVVWKLDFVKIRRMKSSNRYDLLDRAYGKPAVREEKEIVDLPPVVIKVVGKSAD